MTMRQRVEVALLIALASVLAGCQPPADGGDGAMEPSADAGAAIEAVAQAVEVGPADPTSDWAPPTDLESISDVYYGVYMMGNKMGWQHTVVSEGDWRGTPVLFMETTVDLSIEALGESLKQMMRYSIVFDTSGTPLRGHYEVTGAQSNAVTDAVFTEDAVVYTRTTGAGTTEGEVPVPEGADLTDPDITMMDIDPEIGDEREFHMFEPTMMQVVSGSYEVEGEETITVHGEEYDCHYITGHLGPTGRMEVWRDKASDVAVRTVVAGGMQEMLKESREMAMSATEGGTDYTPDLAADTRIVVEDPITAPARKMDLKLRVSNVPSEDVLISDSRQTWSEVEQQADGSFTGVVTVSVPAVPGQVDADLPTGPAEFLAPSPMIEADSPAIVAKAQEMTEGIDEPVAMARALGEGVNSLVTSDASVGSIRSATEVLGDPRGVCRDYAALYAALARAAGIPTKFAAGIVYWNQPGAPGFYYHAWNEVNLDGEEWVAIDTTRPTVWPVDATHIKFAEGDVNCMTDVVGLINVLEIEVLEQ